ncbi:serine/threonine protein kinase [Gigaspora margarita]|uniref:Serine/threonine protein kinase n=1 Tax=Gigaspora margarita TaxID=4874 RepID=A0A8H4ATY3_GIGMA|nr:serine/threonine protein kinase [Gigaspora margarita]
MLDNNKYQLSWIPYKNLKSIEEVGSGGFAKIYKAEFKPRIKNGSTPGFTVALKEFYNDEYFNELRAYMKIGADNPSFLRCYGISKTNMENIF